MNLQKYKVECGDKEHFIKKFKEIMSAEVKTIICIETLMSHVDPVGELPVGFVLMERDTFYLVGWTDRKKRCHPQNLYPHRKKAAILYGNWTKRDWTYCDLYKCVFQRLRQLDEPPRMIASIKNWEDNRQALFTCAKIIKEGDIVQKLKEREKRLAQVLVIQNPELLKSICETLGLEATVPILEKHVEGLYECDIKFTNEEGYAASGILNLIKDHVSSKWNI